MRSLSISRFGISISSQTSVDALIDNLSKGDFIRILGLLFFATCVLASGVDGIWVGQQAGRQGQPEDVAIQFKLDGQSLSGKVFGDEFDIPIAEASFSGDQVRFTVMTTNCYN